MPKSGRRVRIFSALEVANICGVVNQTAINWIRNGHLKAFTTPGGQYRIYAKDLASFLDKRGMGASGEVLHVMMENANWNTFLIAAGPEIGDSIKNSMEGLLPNYVYVQAYDLFETGRKFIEEKPGYLLLDADLPGLDIPKFINSVKSDPVFGRPCVLMLGGEEHNNSLPAESAAESADKVRPDFIFPKPLECEKLAEAIKSMEKQIETAVTA